MNPSALAISYFFHLVATIVWIGGLALLVLVVLPAIGRALADDPARQAALFAALRKRFDPLANLSLVVLVVTGLLQTSGDPNYTGLLIFDSDWSRAILAKHLAIAGMIAIGAVLQLGLAPALERMALRRAAGKDDPAEAARLARRERRLNALNLGLGLLVLAFTAVATAL